jgi:DNA-binding CsgD family transcriptional regulator
MLITLFLSETNASHWSSYIADLANRLTPEFGDKPMAAGLRGLTRHTRVSPEEELKTQRADQNLGEDTTVGDLLRELITRLNDSQQSQTPTEGNEKILKIDIGRLHYTLVSSPSKNQYHLSPREQEIVRLVAEGLPNKCISAVLEISSWTVATHLRRVFAKLGVNSRAAMVAKLLEDPRSLSTDYTD